MATTGSGGVLYKYTNLNNGKVYIGITSARISKRKNAHLRAALKGSQRPFYRAIKKYGINSFSFSIIGTASSREVLSKMEESAICAYHSNVREYGYNVLKGGDGKPYLKLLGENNPAKRPEVKAKWTGKNNYRAKAIEYMGTSYDCIMDAARKTGHPYETIRYRLIAKNLPRQETHQSKSDPKGWEETKKKISSKRLGIKRPQCSGTLNGRSKPILVGNNTFVSIKEAAEFFKVHRSTISNWLKNGRALALNNVA